MSLSVEDAVAALDAMDLTPASAEAPDEVETGAADHEVDDLADEISRPDPTGEDDADGANDGQPDGEEEGETVEPDLPAIDAPKFWDADDKAAFANLPREEQERIAKYEAKASAATSKALQEVAEQRKAAEAVKAQAEAKHVELTQTVEQAAAVFVRKWDGIDWPAFFQQDVQQATIARAEFEQEQGVMKDLLFKKQKADEHAVQTYRQAEVENFQKLATSEPVIAELLDEKEGPARLKEVANYLTSKGVPAERLGDISAVEMELARKAFLYDQAVAKAAAKPAGKPAAHPQPSSPQGKAPMRSAARPPAPSQPAPVKQARNRLAQTGSVDDAVTYLNLRDAQKKRK